MMNIENSLPMAGYHKEQRDEYIYNLLGNIEWDEEIDRKVEEYSKRVQEADTQVERERIRMEFYDFVETKQKNDK